MILKKRSFISVLTRIIVEYCLDKLNDAVFKLVQPGVVFKDYR